jgi:hypothetical protein
MNKDDLYFDKIDTENKAYLFGFILADGHICTNPKNKSVSIEIAKKDLEILKFAKKEFKYAGKIKTTIHNNTLYKRLRIYGNQFTDCLINKGVDSNKTITLKYPLIEENLQRHFIRGYFDGDGCIHISKRKTINKYRYELTIIGTESFSNQLNDIISHTIGFRFLKKFKKTKSNNMICILHTSSIKNIKLFLNWIYYNSTFYLTRKYKIYNKILNTHIIHNCETRKKLSNQNIIDIKYKLKQSILTLREIAHEYGVSHGAISSIKNGKSYKNIN